MAGTNGYSVTEYRQGEGRCLRKERGSHSPLNMWQIRSQGTVIGWNHGPRKQSIRLSIEWEKSCYEDKEPPKKTWYILQVAQNSPLRALPGPQSTCLSSCRSPSLAEREDTVRGQQAENDGHGLHELDGARDGGAAQDEGGHQADLNAVRLPVLDAVTADGIWQAMVCEMAVPVRQSGRVTYRGCQR